MTDLPGEPVDIPVPPNLCDALGVRSDARFIGFEYSPLGDQLVWTDGQSSGSGATWAYLSFKRHPAVRSHLEPYDLGSSEEEAVHMLVIDRDANTASVAPIADARAFLTDQHPPAPELTPEQQALFHEEVERMMREWREQPVDPQAIERQMREQSTRMAVMLAFLDQQVPPGQGQTPS